MQDIYLLVAWVRPSHTDVSSCIFPSRYVKNLRRKDVLYMLEFVTL